MDAEGRLYADEPERVPEEDRRRLEAMYSGVESARMDEAFATRMRERHAREAELYKQLA